MFLGTVRTRILSACVNCAVVATILAAGATAHAQLPVGWQSGVVGGATGTAACAGGTFTLTGSGKGYAQAQDQFVRVFKTIPNGNFRLTARIVSLSGATGSEVGIVARPDAAPSSSCAGASFRLATNASSKPNLFEMFTRDVEPESHRPWNTTSKPTVAVLPFWLQIVRIGNNFGAYKSADGKSWSQIQESSGGAYSAKGPIDAGLFVASGGPNPVTATIDSVTVDTAPVLPYESSWIGNSLIGEASNHVSADVNAMWVAPDGTCYTNGGYEEATQACKIYKNGVVVNPVTAPPGNSMSKDGCITSDGKYLYHWATYTADHFGLFQCNMDGQTGMKPLYMSSPLVDGKGNVMLSGLAAANGELYVSDAMAGKILVADPTQSTYDLPGNATNNVTDHAIDTSGVTNPAPQAVYQTQFENDMIALKVPGLKAGVSYSVRLHFVEFKPLAAGLRNMDIRVGSQSATDFDIVTQAGAPFKAAVLAFANVTPQPDGTLDVTLRKGTGNKSGHAVLAGIEVLNPDGSVAVDLNCGGSGVPGSPWTSTVHEIAARAFDFTRPGPMVVDKRGNLWIIQEGTTFPASGSFDYKPGWGAVKCYSRLGVYQGQQITDVVSPTALAYDAANDRLLVAENGPAQNVRIYSSLTSTPACTSTLGVPGGVFAGATPGVLHDPNSGGDARFLGLTGVGVDAAGNIYVACNGEGYLQTLLSSFTPAGKLNWRLEALEFCNCGDFDPTVNASDVWTSCKHYKMNYDTKTPGSEWSLYSYMWNPFKLGPQPRYASSSVVYRRIGPSKTPFIFTAGQGSMGPLLIYRFVGEQIVPCGRIAQGDGGVWIDTNGDGIEQPSEDQTITGIKANLETFDVDDKGNLYLAFAGRNVAGPNIDKLIFQGVNATGVPLYSTAAGNYVDTPAPGPFAKSWGNNARVRYMGGPLDTLYAIAETIPAATDYTYGGTVVRVDHFSTAPTVTWVSVLPTPANSTDFVAGGPPYSTGDGFLYKAFDVAGKYIFACDLWNSIRVLDCATGNPVRTIVPGPEVSGLAAWEDEVMGIRAHYNAAAGEYDIDTEDSGWDGRLNFYRWKP